MATLHQTQTDYLNAKLEAHTAYIAMPANEDAPDHLWNAYEEAEANLREARYQMCKWGVEVAQNLPFCDNHQKALLKAMWVSAARSPVTLNKLADIVIQLDASTI